MPKRGRCDAAASRLRRVVNACVVLGLLLAACTASGSSPRTSEPPLVAGTFEEAALIAAGEMFRVYGADADPLPLAVTGDIVDRDGQPVWRLDATYTVTIDGERRNDRWILWIGASDEAPLAVLDTDGPSPAP